MLLPGISGQLYPDGTQMLLLYDPSTGSARLSDSLIISSKQVDIIGYWEEKWLAGFVVL